MSTRSKIIVACQLIAAIALFFVALVTSLRICNHGNRESARPALPSEEGTMSTRSKIIVACQLIAAIAEKTAVRNLFAEHIYRQPGSTRCPCRPRSVHQRADSCEPAR
jgi:hypothetical protein